MKLLTALWQHKTSPGCHLAQTLFTSTHLWNYKIFHSIFIPDWLHLKLTQLTTVTTNSQTSYLINLCVTAVSSGILTVATGQMQLVKFCDFILDNGLMQQNYRAMKDMKKKKSEAASGLVEPF